MPNAFILIMLYICIMLAVSTADEIRLPDEYHIRL